MSDSSAEFKLLQAKVNNLESQVRFLLKVNGLDVSALRNAPKTELLGYYRDAVQLLGVESDFAPEMCEGWADVFLQLTEYELERVTTVVDYEHTWEPFYQVCVKMMTSVRHHRDFGVNVALHHLYAQLDKGRRNLRDAAIMMIQRRSSTLPQRAQAILLADDLTEMIKKLKNAS